MVGRCDLDEIRGIALLDQQPDIAFQRWLVTLDRLVRLTLWFPLNSWNSKFTLLGRRPLVFNYLLAR